MSILKDGLDSSTTLFSESYISMLKPVRRMLIDSAFPVIVAAAFSRASEAFYVACVGRHDVSGLIGLGITFALIFHVYGWHCSTRETQIEETEED